ncbi:DUF6049 family protein [Nonomuraea lactucae]|uniref:DUF6049 family protein n=1 Tax=Nonomuraea lactucae TaxID=2249762 RepID=UPI000DE308CD|nr:DUF6049 family protein [Nonomuraea lactucae]
MIRKATLFAALSAAFLTPMAVTTPGTAATTDTRATTATTATTATPAGTEAARQGLSLTVSQITPEWAKGQADEIKISGTIRNDTGAALANLRVRLRYSAQRFTGRAAMEAYQADPNVGTLPPSVSSQSSAYIPSLAAGASAPWEFTLTAAQLTHPAVPSFGVYPIAVEVQQDWRSLAAERTFLTYVPPAQPKLPRNRIAVALPVIDQPHRADDTKFADDELSAALTGKGRLADLARIAKTAPKSVTWFVDPALLDDVNAMVKGYTVATKDGPEKKPADSGAARWLAEMRSALAASPVVATPYADPDVAALAHQGLDPQTGRALELGAQKARLLLKPDVQTDVNWPAAGLIDADALDLLSVGKGDIKVRKVLLNSTNLPPQPPVAVTPDAAATLDSVNGPVTALVADAGLSRMFEPDASRSVLLSRQRFVAETAMIAAEPGQTAPRSLVVAPSRRWDPSPTLVSTLLKTADRLPWLTLTPLGSIKPAKVQVPRAGLTYTEQDLKEELSAKYLGPVENVWEKAQLTSLITSDRPPSAFDSAVLRLASSAWRNQTRAGRAVTKLVDAEVQGTMNQISITGADPDRPRTLAGSNGVVPISVKNTMDAEVTVDVEVTSNNPRLLRVEPQPSTRLVIGGNGQSGTLQVPLTATTSGSGDSTVTVQLKTSDGRPYGKPVELTIRTTGYTGIALVIVGAALTVMLAAVVTRVLRRRSQRRLARAARTRESETV